MTNTATETRSVVVEREIAFPPEKIWRALTQPHLSLQAGSWEIDCAPTRNALIFSDLAQTKAGIPNGTCALYHRNGHGR
jgi:hypothetical protein